MDQSIKEQHATTTDDRPQNMTGYDQLNSNDPANSQLNSSRFDDVNLDSSFAHPNVQPPQQQQQQDQFMNQQFRHPQQQQQQQQQQQVGNTSFNHPTMPHSTTLPPNTSVYSRGQVQSYPYGNYAQSGEQQPTAITPNNQTLPAAYPPNTSVYSRAPNQVQSYPYANYPPQANEQQPQMNYGNQMYPAASHAYALPGQMANPIGHSIGNPIGNPIGNNNNSTFATPYAPTSAAYYSRPQFVQNNHHLLNSSLHHPHSIDLNDSLSRSFNGVPSNFALLNPHPLQAFHPFLGQNNQMNAQLSDFFRKYIALQESLKRNPVNAKNQTPLKFEKLHSSVRFGCSNQLIAVRGKSVQILDIKPRQIEAGGRMLINTWPGPLIKDMTNKNDVIEYIKGQEKLIVAHGLPPEYLYLNAQKSQIWQLLSMMVEQNGELSSSKLAEFLISKNESEFYTEDGGSELGKFRRFLLLGQKKNALDHSIKADLWGHSLALGYLSDQKFSETMTTLVNDFTDLKLSKDDPIFTLYRRLLQDIQKGNPKHRNYIGTVLPPSNLQQFTILLANGCEINPQLPGSEVLRLIVALRDGKSSFIDLDALENYYLRSLMVGDREKYGEELLFMNEIFEFGQKPNLPLIEIIPFKAIFAAKLYDYGLVDQAKRYCEVITNVYKSQLRFMCFDEQKMKRINWQLIMYIVELIESKIDKVVNEQSVLNSFQVTPLSQQIEEDDQQSRTSSDPEDADDSVQTDTVNEDVAELRLNSEQSMASNPPAANLYQQPNKFASVPRSQPQFANPPNLAASQPKKVFNQLPPPPAPAQHRERSDSEQSYSRQRTTSRTSSNLSFSGPPVKSETIRESQQQQQQQQTKSQFNQPPNRVTKTSDLPQPSLASSSSLPLSSNAAPPSDLPSKQPAKQEAPPKPAAQSFFVPKFSPSDNLPPPIDFVSKPPMDPTNFLEENEENERNNAVQNSSLPPAPSMPTFNPSFNDHNNFNPNLNFNSTLNPPPPTSQISQNYMFSPAVSPITSPVLNTNQANRVNLTMRPDNRLDNRSERKMENTSLDQADGEQSKNTAEKSGFFSSWFNKSGPKEAHLPDDSKQRFVYDNQRKVWVDTEAEGDEQNQMIDQIRQGPPKIPVLSNAPQQPNRPPLMSQTSNQSTGNHLPASSQPGGQFTSGPPAIDPSQYSFMKSKQRRYVDITQQN